MKVLVMTAVAGNGQDLQIVIVVPRKHTGPVSPVITLKGAVSYRDGNPYLVYGDVVAAFAGCDKLDTSISVFECHSGNLENCL